MFAELSPKPIAAASLGQVRLLICASILTLQTAWETCSADLQTNMFVFKVGFEAGRLLEMGICRCTKAS